MNLFGKEPQELAIRTLIHDTNNALGNLKHWNKRIEEWIKQTHKTFQEKGIEMKDNPYIYTEYVKSDIQKLLDTLDYYYEQAKNDFKDEH